MNEVNVSGMKTEVNRLNTLLDNYQENYLNLYHEIKNSNLYWTDPHALMFFDAKEIEKNKIDVSYQELLSLKNVYDLTIDNYEKLGNYIEFNTTRREELLSKINIYINKLNRIITMYNNLDYSFADYSIISAIDNQKDNVREMLDNARELKNKIKDIISDINESEIKIRNEISKIKIEVLPITTTERFI